MPLYYDKSNNAAGFGTLNGGWTDASSWNSNASGTGANGNWIGFPFQDVGFGSSSVASTTFGTVTIPTATDIGLLGITKANLTGAQVIAASGTGRLLFQGTTPYITMVGGGGLTFNTPVLMQITDTTPTLTISGTGGSPTFNATSTGTYGLKGKLVVNDSFLFFDGDNRFPDAQSITFNTGLFLFHNIAAGATINIANKLISSAGRIQFNGGTIYNISGDVSELLGTPAIAGSVGEQGPLFGIAPFNTDGSPRTINLTHGTLPTQLSFYWNSTTGNTSSTINYAPSTVPSSSFNTTIYLIPTGTSVSSDNTLNMNQPAGNNVTFTGGVIRVGTAGTAFITLGGSSASINTMSGVIRVDTANAAAGALLGVKKTGGTTWVLDAINTYTGGTTISGGVIRATNASSLGTGSITMSSGTTLELSNASLTNAFTAIGSIKNIAGTNTLSSSTTLAGATTLNVEAGTLTLSGQIADSSGFALNKIGDGVATLSNSNNNFIGTPNISAGVLAVPSISALGAGSALTLSASGVLRYTGAVGTSITRPVNGSSLNGAGFENSGSSNLIVTSGTLSGTIKLGAATDGAGQYNTLRATISSGGFTKAGPGRWIVTTINNLSGATTVSGGTLMAAPTSVDTAAKLLGGNVTVQAGGRIQTSSDNGQAGRNRYTDLAFAGTVGSPARIRIGGSAVNPTVQMSGNLTISGSVTWNLTADTFKTPNTYRLFEFLSGELVGGSSALNNVTLQLPAGRTLAPGGLVYDGLSSPKTITVTIN